MQEKEHYVRGLKNIVAQTKVALKMNYAYN